MPITKDINVKANLRQKTDADLLSNLSQPVIAVYEADSVASQSMIPDSGNLPFIVDIANRENVEVFVDGRFLSYGKDYEYAEITGNNTSSKISLFVPMMADLPINVIKRGLKKESEFGTDNRFTELYEALDVGFQGFVDESATLSPVSGIPGAGQFRTFGIQNRAKIVDPSIDIKARIGIERIPVQSVYEALGEYGPSGEKVWGAYGDDKNMIRFVGSWVSQIATNGYYMYSGVGPSDFVEIVFYGTGLNLLTAWGNQARDIRVTVDAGAEGVNVMPQSAQPTIGRTYASNTILPITSGLTFGLHTVKIRNASASQDFYVHGFEVLNESNLVKIQPGTAYIQGKKIPVSSQSAVAYNASFESILRDGVSEPSISTKGGHILSYLKSDRTFGKAIIEANASQGNMVSADHSNEELVRIYHFREFGSGRGDDWTKNLFAGTSDVAYSLDDDTTTLVGNNVSTSGTFEGAFLNDNATGFFDFTFVGTGADLVWLTSTTGTNSNANSHEVFVDGTSIGNIQTTSPGAGVHQITKLVSGLPYGTHTVRVFRNAPNSWALALVKLLVYAPKKPTLPAGAIEINSYYLMANHVVLGGSYTDKVSNGVLRKTMTREMTYSGTAWSLQLDTSSPNSPTGWYAVSNTNTSYIEYIFFGTGVEFVKNDSAAYTLSIDGSSVLTGFSTGTAFGAPTITAGTGAVSSGAGSVYVKDLPLGKHTVRVTKTDTNNSAVISFDVITPIHDQRLNLSCQQGNTMSVGSCSVADLRNLSPVKSENIKNNFVYVTDISGSNPSTTSSVALPIPGQTATINIRKGKKLRVDFVGGFQNSTGGAAIEYYIYIDGIQVAHNFVGSGNYPSNTNIPAAMCWKGDVGSGIHRVDIYWSTNTGTATSIGSNRSQLIVEECD